jgi:hypothetical protein
MTMQKNWWGKDLTLSTTKKRFFHQKIWPKAAVLQKFLLKYPSILIIIWCFRCVFKVLQL